MAKKKSDIIWDIIGILIIALIIALLEQFIFYPIMFYIMHDCGKFFCSCSPEISWTVFSVCYIGSLFIAIYIYFASDKTPGNRIPRKKNYYGGGRETDYFDSDMEGGGGYYGW